MQSAATLHPSPSRDALLVATTGAMVAGAIEAGSAGIKIFLLHRFAWVSYDVAWMSPLAYLLLFVPLAIVMIAAFRLLGRTVPLKVPVACFAFLAAFSALLPYESIARWAAVLLAGGLGVRLAMLAAADPVRSTRIMRRLAFSLALLSVVTGIAVRGTRALRERAALALLPPPGTGPNILLIILDTVRRANLGLYGYARATTPSIQRRAAEGVVFEHAFAAAPWTLPSHASLFTGLRAADLGTGWFTPLPAVKPTLAEVLRARGYWTGGFVANMFYTSYESELRRGFIHYDGYRISAKLVLLHSVLMRTKVAVSLMDDRSPANILRAIRQFEIGRVRSAADLYYRDATSVTDGFLEWSSAAKGRPYLAFLNYFDAHGPYHAPKRYLASYGTNPSKLDRYDAAIQYIDGEVGRLIDSLERRHELERTIVVIASDHGEQFGEHGMSDHGNSLYMPLLAVPLIIRYPAGVPSGLRVASVVSMRDVAATILALTGNPSGLPGEPLTRHWQPGGLRTATAAIADLEQSIGMDTRNPNGRGPISALIDDRIHYIRGTPPREELFEWRIDTLEARDLSSDPRMRDVLADARARLAAEGQTRQLPRR